MIIKSDKNKQGLVIFIVMTVWFIYEILWPPRDMFVYCFPPLYIVLFFCSVWDGRTLIMDSEGCTVCFGPFKKIYMWDELSVKCIWNFRYTKGLGEREGVVFSKHEMFRPKGRLCNAHSILRPPMSYFYVFFSTNEPWMYQGRAISKLYPVNEEEFMEKMRLWHVELEDCRNDNK